MVPEGWKTADFSEAGIAIIDGDRGKEYPKESDFSDNGYCVFLTAKNVTKSGFRFNEVQFISKEKHRNLRKGEVNRGNIVLTTRGTVGQFAYFDEAVPYEVMRINSGMVVLDTSRSEISSDFLYAVCRSRLIKKQIESASFGSAQPALTVKVIKKIKLPIPPSPEQKKIAQILSTWDQAITATERLLDNSRQRKKGLMQQLLTGKRRLPGFEGEWSQHPLTEVAKVIVSPVDKKSQTGEQPVLLCNYTDIYYNTRIVKEMPFMNATASEIEIEKYLLRKGDVVITKDSETPGDIAVPALIAEDLGGVVCGYHLAILRANPKKLHGAFLNYLLSMPKTRYYFFSLATGATRFGLSVGAIHNAVLTLPVVSEQEAIADKLTICDDEIETIAKRLACLKCEKKALMQQLLTGKRRVKVDAGAA